MSVITDDFDEEDFINNKAENKNGESQEPLKDNSTFNGEGYSEEDGPFRNPNHKDPNYKFLCN